MKPSTMGVSQEISQGRTSSTLWLHDRDCKVPLRVLAGRVSRIVGLDASHMENLQVVRYEEGQMFDMHTDHLDEFNKLECKGRLATCLVYLNSSNEGSDTIKSGEFDGGSTYFPEYESHVIPKQGRAVFWLNTVERPGTFGYSSLMNLNVDLRSRHAGSPVQNGEKWICNRWVHPIPLYNGVRDDSD
jgi:prolyl 4-hydroxylase